MTFSAIKEELNILQRAIQEAVESDPCIPPGTPLAECPPLLAKRLQEQADLVARYINALGPHMSPDWKEAFVQVFGFEIDMGNPYHPVRSRKPR